jgi:hypothetical protein
VLSALLSQTGGSLAALYALSGGSWSPSLIDVQQHFTATGGSLSLQPGNGYLLYSDRAAPTFTTPIGTAARDRYAQGAPAQSRAGGAAASRGVPPLPPLPAPLTSPNTTVAVGGSALRGEQVVLAFECVASTVRRVAIPHCAGYGWASSPPSGSGRSGVP